jgi:hypothetical protein
MREEPWSESSHDAVSVRMDNICALHYYINCNYAYITREGSAIVICTLASSLCSFSPLTLKPAHAHAHAHPHPHSHCLARVCVHSDTPNFSISSFYVCVPFHARIILAVPLSRRTPRLIPLRIITSRNSLKFINIFKYLNE